MRLENPDKNKPWKDTVKSTKNGPAKYSPDIKDIEAFERETWERLAATSHNRER